MTHNHLAAPKQDQEFEDKDNLRLVPVHKLWKEAYLSGTGNYTPGVKEMNVNNGMVYRTDGRVSYNEPGTLEELQAQGYSRNPNGEVPIGNGMGVREMDEIMPELIINRAARESGAQNREVTFISSDGNEITWTTSDPFDAGEFIEISRSIAEISADGQEIWHVDLARDKIVDPAFVENIGRWNANNGVIEVITTDGDRQITKDTEARRKRLADMGYAQNPSMTVAHSNGEQWNMNRSWSQVSDPANGNTLGTAPEIWDRIAA